MRYPELAMRLHEMGCGYLHDAPGSHKIWWNPATGKTTVIARHEGSEIPTGTFHSILRDLGLSYQNSNAETKRENHERIRWQTSHR